MVKFSMPLSNSAIEVLHGLFIEGPLWDGDLPSKSGRDELVNMGLVERFEGYQFLARKGILMAIENGLHTEKHRRVAEKQKALRVLRAVESSLNPPSYGISTDGAGCCNTATNAASPSGVEAAGYLTATEIDRRARERLTDYSGGHDYAKKERDRVDG